MAYEVELKFPLSDVAAVRARLRELDAVSQPAVTQTDRYFQHPSRDFGQSNEALRVRSLGDRCVVTYKGPIVDRAVKTRREIELPIGTTAGEGDEFAEMLVLLGFRPVRTVVKSRESFHCSWKNIPMEVAIDTVPSLGAFIEIETLADDSNRAERQNAVLEMATAFGLGSPERRSYLTMLLQQDRSPDVPTSDTQ